jgi:hypothetical protein
MNALAIPKSPVGSAEAINPVIEFIQVSVLSVDFNKSFTQFDSSVFRFSQGF